MTHVTFSFDKDKESMELHRICTGKPVWGSDPKQNMPKEAYRNLAKEKP